MIIPLVENTRSTGAEVAGVIIIIIIIITEELTKQCLCLLLIVLRTAQYT